MGAGSAFAGSGGGEALSGGFTATASLVAANAATVGGAAGLGAAGSGFGFETCSACNFFPETISGGTLEVCGLRTASASFAWTTAAWFGSSGRRGISTGQGGVLTVQPAIWPLPARNTVTNGIRASCCWLLQRR
jgi:hypothetical protein